MDSGSSFYENHKEFILYTVVGVSSVVVNWLCYSWLVAIMPMVLANGLSWAITVLCTFVLNKIYVFGSSSWEHTLVLKELVTFFTSRGVTGVLEIVAQPQLYAWGLNKDLFGVEGLEAKITVCVILSLVNYVSTKWFVFRQESTKKVESV